MCSTRSSSRRSQKHFSMVQSRTECLELSLHDEQIEHPTLITMLRCSRTVPVGSDWWASLHRNTLIFLGTFVFHSDVHHFSSVSILELATRPSSQSSWAFFIVTSMR
jgi:hypothetical protein